MIKEWGYTYQINPYLSCSLPQTTNIGTKTYAFYLLVNFVSYIIVKICIVMNIIKTLKIWENHKKI